MAIKKLEAAALFRGCDIQSFDFETTADLELLDEIIGQPRAVDAVRFGIGIRRDGYNLFAFGPAGTGKRTLVQRYAVEQAAREALPPDRCYINNFQESGKPRVLSLPAGGGIGLQRDVEQVVDDLHAAIPASFESSEYRTRAQAIEEEIGELHEQALKQVRENAEKKGIGLIQTPTGFTLAPVRNGKTLRLEEFERLTEEERQRIQKDTGELQGQLSAVLHELPKLQKQGRDRLNALNREMAGATVAHLIESLVGKYVNLAAVTAFLNDVRDDVINNFRHFLQKDETPAGPFGGEFGGDRAGLSWENRYRVNILVSHEDHKTAPVVYEDHPSYNNLIGRIEHQAQFGTLVTDFTMIRPGALHRANGGYLILDALKVLTQPFAWDCLKRALQAGEIRIESLAQLTGLISTVSLEPEPIPLDLKVILLGERYVYYLLSYLDPEFGELFKVAADFGDSTDRSPATQLLYARLIASIAAAERLRPFDRAAVARLIEQSSRLLGDSEKLATHMRDLADLMQEADYWAQQRQTAIVGGQDVQRAIDTQGRRMDRLRELVQDQIRRGVLMIDTAGARTGRVNGLSVLEAGGFRFGHPVRITATVRIGDNQVVDIEREVKLGGPLHSKGVFILSAFLGARYAPDQPLTLSASLVFEQSYGHVEGDSASSAELFALLSALAGIPVRQSLAVTGSVNQQGEIQPIGAVNEKIEGFFDICTQKGLAGDQGVVIPAGNVVHLMLREDVRAAVAAGTFAIHAIETVDDGIELLTGVPAGTRGDDGLFAEGSVNRAVEDRLIRYAESMRAFVGKSGSGDVPRQTTA